MVKMQENQKNACKNRKKKCKWILKANQNVNCGDDRNEQTMNENKNERK